MAAFVVDSGNGLQPLWRLAYAPKEWKPIENINCAIAKKLGSDSCHNIDRLLRVPGTINWPDATKRARGRAPVLARLAHDGGPEAIYTPDQLARVFPPIPGADKESKTSGEDIGEVELLTPDDLGLSSLSPLRSVIEHPTGHDRSRDGLRAAGDLLRAGFTKLQVLGILLNPKNKVSAHYMDQADPRRAALRVIQWLEEHKSDDAGSPDLDQVFGGAPSGPLSGSASTSTSRPKGRRRYWNQHLAGRIDVWTTVSFRREMNVAHTGSVSLWFWVIGAIILGIFIAYGLWKTGRLSPRERQVLEPPKRSAGRPL